MPLHSEYWKLYLLNYDIVILAELNYEIGMPKFAMAIFRIFIDIDLSMYCTLYMIIILINKFIDVLCLKYVAVLGTLMKNFAYIFWAKSTLYIILFF